MKIKKITPAILPVLFIILQVVACQDINVQEYSEVLSPKEEAVLWERSTTYLFPQDKDQLLQDVGATVAQIDLGKELFFEERLSLNKNQSCNSCHDLNNYGVDNKQVSEGSNGAKGIRNSPTVYDAAFQYAQFWDGRASSVEEQAGFPILNPMEMGMPNEAAVISRIEKISKYKTGFTKAFPDDDTPITFANITKALGAFERTLITNSRFDDYTNGDFNALSYQEKKGLTLFLDLNCAPCHSGSSVGGLMPQRFGQIGEYSDYTGLLNSDKGMADISDSSEDENVFKVPSLRNVIHTAPYFHDGSVETIEEAIRVMAKAQLNMDLSNDEVDAIKSFFECLSISKGEEAALVL